MEKIKMKSIKKKIALSLFFPISLIIPYYFLNRKRKNVVDLKKDDDIYLGI